MTSLNVAIEAALQMLATGLMVGLIYGLMATGVGVIFGIMRVVNFAQGEFLMFSMYAAVAVAGVLAITPLGGVAFVAGWSCLALAAGREDVRA